MLNRRRFLAALALVSVPRARTTRGLGQPSRPALRRWSTVQDLLNERVKLRNIAGAVAGLSYGGEPFTYIPVGRLALDSDVAVDENSIYRLASVTKVVTGIAAMTLVEEGKLRLDQPVADVIPEWKSLGVAVDARKSLDSRPAKTIMTVRHLLTHTSGLAYWIPAMGSDPLPSAYRARGITPGDYGRPQGRPGYGPQATSLTDMIARVAELPLAADPGTVYQYSMGYDVMGLIIERVTGKPLDVYFNERIFKPLQMTSTGFQVSPAETVRFTTNYEASSAGLTPIDRPESSVWLRPPTLAAGGAGLVSTARDFTRITALLLGQGTVDGRQVLRADTARLACSNLLPKEVVADSGYGAGMRITLSNKERSWRSPGSIGTLSFGGAMGCRWMVDPARRGMMVFMTQRMPADFSLWNQLHSAIDADLA
jgi:CubicO group peptidase (beta-lactamase class C family)